MGTLYLVSTPIGNLEDITIRALKTLFSVSIIACEDTRRTGILLKELQVRFTSIIQTIEVCEHRLMSYYDDVEQAKLPELIGLLEQGKDIALISDAGTPLINDPGFILVREAIKRKIRVVSIPGPTAVISALTVSGLPPDKFLYLGYAPEKTSHRIKLFNDLLQMNRFLGSTYIFYCAPHKLEQTLVDMKEVFGDREIVVARELTKVHEEVLRGTISEVQSTFKSPIGEIVLLFTLK